MAIKWFLRTKWHESGKADIKWHKSGRVAMKFQVAEWQPSFFFGWYLSGMQVVRCQQRTKRQSGIQDFIKGVFKWVGDVSLVGRKYLGEIN